MRHTFIFTDESTLNSYGFRVMTGGGNFEMYNSNPLVLWMHRRPTRWKDENSEEDVFPIGLGYNVRIKGTQGLVDVEFDENDPFAKKIMQKVESGIIRMASPGIEPITWTSDPKFLLPGQKGETLLEWQLTEISIVDMGSNRMALKLYNSQKEVIELNAGNQHNYIPLLKTDSKNENRDMELLAQVAVLLGKPQDTAQDSVVVTLKERLQLAAQADDYKTKYETLLGEITLAKEKEITTLVDSMIGRKITADKKNFYVKLGKDSGIESLRTVLDSIQPFRKASEIILTKQGESKGDAEIKTFSDLKKQGMEAVELFKKENPEEYKRLFREEYNFDTKI